MTTDQAHPDHARPDHARPDHTHPDHTRPDQAHPETRSRAVRSTVASPLKVDAVLEAVCRNVAELARTAPNPPSRILMEEGQTRVEVEWPDPVRVEAARVPPADTAVSVQEPGAPAGEPADTLACIRSPMVGTFYHAGAPGSPPFVQVGDVVQQGQQVGVLEAMKMMSSVTADSGGRVVEVLAANAQRVEFDQPLISLEPVAGADGGA